MAESSPSFSEAERLIHRELDGLLTPEEARRLEALAAADPAVRRERAGFAFVRSALRADVASVEVRPGLAAALAEGARREPAPVVVGPWGRAAAAAAAFLVGCTLFGLGRWSVEGRPAVYAGPRVDEKNDADLRTALASLGLKPDEVEAQLEIGRRYDRLRAEVLEGVRPNIEALDREERAEKWSKLSPEARKLWRAKDPRVMPPEPEGR